MHPQVRGKLQEVWVHPSIQLEKLWLGGCMWISVEMTSRVDCQKSNGVTCSMKESGIWYQSGGKLQQHFLQIARMWKEGNFAWKVGRCIQHTTCKNHK
jgi:hypothetical protein